jgi:hypothetical protein
MEIKTLGDLLQNQQNQILSLSLHMDCLIEELENSGFLDSDKLGKRMKRKLKKLQAVADKIKEKEEVPPMFNYGGPIGEA